MPKHGKSSSHKQQVGEAEGVVEAILLWPLHAFRATQAALKGHADVLQVGAADAAAIAALMYGLGEAGAGAGGAEWVKGYLMAGVGYAAVMALFGRDSGMRRMSGPSSY